MRTISLGLAAALAFAPVSVHAQAGKRAAPTASAACNEDCLLGVAAAYMDSLTANDPKGAPFAPNVRHTENGAVTALTDGLWKTGTSWGYRHTFTDPVAGQVGAFGVVREGDPKTSGDKLAIVAIRLKVVGRRITESELMVARKADTGIFNPTWLVEPRAQFKAVLPPEQRSTREFLAGIPQRYFNALSTGHAELIPVHPDTIRIENGVQTTSNIANGSPSVQEGLGGGFVYMEHAAQVRVPIVDVRRGLVLGITRFDMPAKDRTVMIRGRPVQITAEARRLPRAIMLYELFKVEDGRVTGIEAVLRTAKIGEDMGWGGKP